MVPVSRIKMSKRDLARARFVQNHRRNLEIKKSVKNQLILETEKIKDFADDTASLRRMTYKELVEDFNKDIKALE
jgi:ribosomal protein L29